MFEIQVFGKHLEQDEASSVTGFTHDGWSTVQTCEAEEVAQALHDRHQASGSKYSGPVRIVEVTS